MKKNAGALHLKKSFSISASTVVDIVATLFILLFGFTGFYKLFTREQFAANMTANKMLIPFADFLSYAVPIVEIIITVLLLFPVVTIGKKTILTRRTGIYLSALLMLLFSLYVIIVLVVLKNHLPCTCGGFINTLSWPQHLFFNLSALFVALISIMLTRKNKFSMSY